MRRWLHLGTKLGTAALLAWPLPVEVSTWTRVSCVLSLLLMLEGVYQLGRQEERDALRAERHALANDRAGMYLREDFAMQRAYMMVRDELGYPRAASALR